MKALLTGDIHQHTPKWEQLSSVVEEEKPDFVLIAGDLLPKTGGFKGQRDFFPRLRRHLAKMRDAGAQLLLMMSNDDFMPLEPMLDELAGEGLCVNMNGRVHRERGLTFCGVAQVRDYPFGYKDWCVPDGDFIQSPVQFCGEGLTVDQEGKWVNLDNLRAHLLQKPSLGQRLESLVAQLSPAEMPRSIWLVHQPPADLGMDICASGERVGSPTLLEWMRHVQPALTLHGHIHESPQMPGGKWIGLVRNTVANQPGQMAQRLHYVSLEITDQYNLRNIRHSIFGPTTIEFERFSSTSP